MTGRLLAPTAVRARPGFSSCMSVQQASSHTELGRQRFSTSPQAAAPADHDDMFYSQEDEAMGISSGAKSGYTQIASDSAPNTPPPESEKMPSHGAYGSFVGYCFTVNYILGVGVLGMPYAFYKGGWVLSTLCLGLVTIVASYTALWLVDVSLRAQYLKRQGHLLRDASGGPSSRIAALEINQPVSNATHHRFEINELVQMFLGVKARRFYELLVIIYLVGALWSYSSVFSSSLASHVPLPGLNHGKECDIYKDHSQECTDLYLAYMGMFAVVVLPLTCLELSEMKVMQIVLAIFRFVSLGTMMITSVVAMYSYPNPEPTAHSTASKPYTSDVTAFDWGNLGLVFPIAMFAQIFHHSVPGLSYPLTDKRAAPRVFTSVLATTFVLYSALGITVSFYYGASIPQTCTIAWADYSGGRDAAGESKPHWASFISYLIVLFPPIDIISAFPLNAITLGNNLMCAFVEDEQKQRLKRYKLPFRMLAAAPPIVGAMLVKDLSMILKYTGCVGVLIAFVYPVFLQWSSVRTCQRLAIVVARESPDGNAEDDDDSAAKTSVPTYNGRFINAPIALWVVLGFSLIGLVGVIVLSAMGMSG